MSTEDKDFATGTSTSSVNLTDLLLSYLANWKWFALSVVVCFVLAYFYKATQIPQYRIDASLYLSEDKNSASNAFNLDAAADPMVALKSFIDETELEVLKSRNNLVRIVDSLGLAYTYYQKGTLRNVPLYQNNAIIAHVDSASLRALKSPINVEVSPAGNGKYNVKARTKVKKIKEKKEFKDVSLPFSFDMATATVSLSKSPVIKTDDKKEKTEIIVINSPLAVAKNLSASFNIEFAKKSEKIMRISLTTDVVKKGDDIIYALLDFYNADIIEDKNKSAVQTEAFILDRLVMLTNELKDVENRLQQYRQAHNVTDINLQQALNLDLQSQYASESAGVEAQMAVYKEIERIVSNAGTYQALPAAVEDPAITKAIEDYNRKVSQLNRTLEGSTPDNPLVISLQDELSRDKVRILQTLETAQRNLSTKRSSIRRLENKSSSALASTPGVDKGFQEIFREQQVKVNIYTFLLQRREEIALQKTLATNTARLIDNPDSGDAPVSPRGLIIYAVALILGLAIPAGIIYVRRLIFPVFSDKNELKHYTKIPIIGEICQLTEIPQDSSEIVVRKNASSPEAELFRLLRNNLTFTRGGKNSQVVLVTSTVSGEGKTFISANLAMTYALTGKKVCVVGLDLRRHMLAHRFGFNNAHGVTTYLTGIDNDLGKIVLQSKEDPNLYVLPAGPVPPNPNELLMSDRMADMVAELRKNFDYIIFDTAPVGLISDTYLLVRYSDIQLFVTRANYSSKSNLGILQEAVDANKLSAVYIVLNGVNIGANSYMYRRYGHYGHNDKKGYGYGYGYVSHSEEDKKKK